MHVKEQPTLVGARPSEGKPLTLACLEAASVMWSSCYLGMHLAHHWPLGDLSFNTTGADHRLSPSRGVTGCPRSHIVAVAVLGLGFCRASPCKMRLPVVSEPSCPQDTSVPYSNCRPFLLRHPNYGRLPRRIIADYRWPLATSMIGPMKAQRF